MLKKYKAQTVKKEEYDAFLYFWYSLISTFWLWIPDFAQKCHCYGYKCISMDVSQTANGVLVVVLIHQKSWNSIVQ